MHDNIAIFSQPPQWAEKTAAGFSFSAVFVIMVLREGVVGAVTRRVPSQHRYTTRGVWLG
jgi:hypothetical protein